ncbi:MAG TPA: hypothetical protein PLR20_15260 [Syntrophales bacterium]|jgi:hypothetical protein|nr:hypothetical protein [Syntrophales bacterium]
MLGALWSLEFESILGDHGTGVVVLETDRLFGGDAQYFYIGNYKVRGCVLEADVVVQHYAGPPFSIFGLTEIHKVILKGKIEVPVMKLQGHLANDPSQTFSIKCVKRADLP